MWLRPRSFYRKGPANSPLTTKPKTKRCILRTISRSVIFHSMSFWSILIFSRFFVFKIFLVWTMTSLFPFMSMEILILHIQLSQPYYQTQIRYRLSVSFTVIFITKCGFSITSSSWQRVLSLGSHVTFHFLHSHSCGLFDFDFTLNHSFVLQCQVNSTHDEVKPVSLCQWFEYFRTQCNPPLSQLT